MMQLYVAQNTQIAFSTFLINTLLQTRHEMNVVEGELLSIWATVHKERQKDSLILIYSDFLNEVLQG